MKSFQNNILESETKKSKKENALDIISKSMFNFLNLNVMSNLRNQVQLIGNVGNAPETITFESGKKVCRLSLATNEYYKREREKLQDTQWHNLVAWGNQAELLENYASKVMEIAVQGKLTTRSYKTEGGSKKYVTEVLINEILFLGNNENTHE